MRFNTGEGARLGNETNGDQPLLPGSSIPWTSWFEQFQHLSLIPTPGDDLLAAYLERLQERNTPRGSAVEFNEALLAWVLENQRGLTPDQLVVMANALELNTQVP